MRVAAAFRPLWSSEITSLTPRRPRRASERRKSVRKVSASDAPTAMPSTSRRPRSLTATAMVTATGTMRPASRIFTQVASSHRYGQSPSSGRSRKSRILPSISPHSRDTRLLEMPDMPIACTGSSTERVDTPLMQASWIVSIRRRPQCIEV